MFQAGSLAGLSVKVFREKRGQNPKCSSYRTESCANWTNEKYLVLKVEVK